MYISDKNKRRVDRELSIDRRRELNVDETINLLKNKEFPVESFHYKSILRLSVKTL